LQNNKNYDNINPLLFYAKFMTSMKVFESKQPDIQSKREVEVPKNIEMKIDKEVITEATSTKQEILANGISPGQLFESERKTGNVMKNFIRSLGDNKFEVNFDSNSQAEHNIWLSDLLWEEVRAVRVIGEKNGIKYDMTWDRQWLKGWFYNEKWKYIPVFNNFKIEVLKILDKQELTKQKEENEAKVTELLNSPFVEKFKNKYSKEQLEIIVRKSQEYSIDPCLLLALRTTENGRTGLDFGVMRPGIDTFDWQLTVACRIIQNGMNRYARMTGQKASEWDWRFRGEFIGYFSSIYAPIWANNDSTNLNNNHLKNLLAFYWEYTGKRFDNIDELVNNNYAFLKKWEVQMTSGEIIWSTTADYLIANASEHIGKWYVWWWGRTNTDVTDCSGLLLMAMKEAWVVDHGYNNTAEWLSRITKQKVPKDVVRWDLVFLQEGGKITHVEIATWPAMNWQIPIIDSSTNNKWVSYRQQPINEKVLVGTPIFYKA